MSNHIRILDFEEPYIKDYILDQLKKQTETTGTHLISFYCKNLNSSKMAIIKQEQNLAKSIKSKQTQKKVIESIDHLLDLLSKIPKQLDSFVVFVKGSYDLVVKLPPYLSKNIYHCGKKFLTESLENYSTLTWGILVLDTQEVSIGLLQNNSIKLLKNYEVHIPGKIKAGGQSSVRFEQTRKNLVFSHIKTVSEYCNQLFKEHKIQKLLLGGITPTVDLFYNSHHLSKQLKQILAYPVNTVYTNSKGLEEVLEKKKDEYAYELDLYFKQKNVYDSICQKRSDLYTLDELKHLPFYLIKNVYYTDPTFRNLIFCKECSVFNASCEHKKIAITEYPGHVFSVTSEYGIEFNKRFRILFEVDFNLEKKVPINS